MTAKELIENGYTIENVKITNADLTMANCGCLTLEIELSGDCFGVCYGGYALGKGWLGAKDDEFKGSAKGEEAIMKIMNVIGVDSLNQLKGKYARIATKSYGSTVKIIGNIISDKWFNYEEHFKEVE